MKICFNEAEALKPRIPISLTALTVCSTPCFNEAEALKPRIRGQCVRIRARAECFNEAEALKPRIQ